MGTDAMFLTFTLAEESLRCSLETYDVHQNAARAWLLSNIGILLFMTAVPRHSIIAIIPIIMSIVAISIGYSRHKSVCGYGYAPARLTKNADFMQKPIDEIRAGIIKKRQKSIEFNALINVHMSRCLRAARILTCLGTITFALIYLWA